jgi:hypothetical protein
MNEQLLNEIGERLKNGEDLLSIKADLISKGVEFDQFDVLSNPPINQKVEYNFVRLIQKYIIGFTFIFGCSTFIYNITEIKSPLLYFLIVVTTVIGYFKYLQKYILEFVFDLNKYVRLLVILLILYLIAKYNPSYNFNTQEVQIGILNSVNTN